MPGMMRGKKKMMRGGAVKAKAKPTKMMRGGAVKAKPTKMMRGGKVKAKK